MKPAGTEVGLYLDTRDPIDVGDEVETATGRRYLVVRARRQERGKYAGRWHLRCRVLEVGAARDPDSRVIGVTWYRRGDRGRRYGRRHG